MIVSKNRCVEPKISTFLSKGTNGNGHVACHETWRGASKDAFEFTFEDRPASGCNFSFGSGALSFSAYVSTRPSGTVILEETDPDLYRAIDRAAHRVGSPSDGNWNACAAKVGMSDEQRTTGDGV